MSNKSRIIKDLSQMEVLVLDDDNFQRQLMRRMLSQIGVNNIHEAVSVKEALELVELLKNKLDFIISDLDMPEIDGMEFLRILSELKVDVPVLIVSGKHGSIIRSVNEMAREYGVKVVASLPKPLKLPVLSTLLQDQLLSQADMPARAVYSFSAEDIKKGLQAGEFIPYYQPKVSLSSRKVTGVEVLARWNNPEKGLLAPDYFIDLMEEYGLMEDLTWLMLEQALKQLRIWHDKGCMISISVNFSQSSLAETTLPKRILDLMSSYDLNPEYLTIEITETLAMSDIAHCLETLTRMRIKGFGLSVDDFGTGHSSLHQLSRVPFTELKIDKVFVNKSATQAHLQAVIETSISMAKKLGLQCVAEGIETEEDLECLEDYGCEMGQGYFFGKPMEISDFDTWMQSSS